MLDVLVGIACRIESQTAIIWNGECLNWTNNNRLPLNEARNACIKGGGDLATFSDEGNLDRLRRVSYTKDFAATEHWVGLHRKWWIWNSSGALKIYR